MLAPCASTFYSEAFLYFTDLVFFLAVRWAVLVLLALELSYLLVVELEWASLG